ncbi:MAG: hypothetical protein FWE54_01625 [Methanimicrococcus sp.]|nr:hypothetical protein [Methanimicrococcus sp.]
MNFDYVLKNVHTPLIQSPDLVAAMTGCASKHNTNCFVCPISSTDEGSKCLIID